MAPFREVNMGELTISGCRFSENLVRRVRTDLAERHSNTRQRIGNPLAVETGWNLRLDSGEDRAYVHVHINRG